MVLGTKGLPHILRDFGRLYMATKPLQHTSCLSSLAAKVTATKQAKTRTTTLLSKRNSCEEYNLLKRDSIGVSDKEETELLGSSWE